MWRAGDRRHRLACSGVKSTSKASVRGPGPVGSVLFWPIGRSIHSPKSEEGKKQANQGRPGTGLECASSMGAMVRNVSGRA